MGGNLGDVPAHLAAARRALVEWSTEPLVESPLYASEPWGLVDQSPFVNQVIGLALMGEPGELLDRLQALERERGRVPGPRWGPRPLDLDLLCWSDRQIHTPRLSVPHPRIAERRFVLAPWADVAPDLVVPGLSRSVADLLAACGDRSWVRRCS